MCGVDGMAIDDGTAVHYTAVEPGTPVYASDETQVGTVQEILDPLCLLGVHINPESRVKMRLVPTGEPSRR